MDATEPTFRNVSDTAIWAALYRARENERPDALFRDPFARRLAGDRGERMAEALRSQDRYAWAWVLRTVLFDRFISEQISAGTDLVVNLAAGLDARPYRMSLPRSLQWVEVDLPGILDYKEQVLRNDEPVCALERVRLDIAEAPARRDLFRRLADRSTRALVITEGLLIYLSNDEVTVLAEDVAATHTFGHWVLDIASPGLLRLLQKEVGAELDRAAAPLKFAPVEGPAFFEPHGWRPVAVESPLKAAARAGRLPLLLRFFALFPASAGPKGKRPWSGICLFERRGA
jgi:methyltransferase (TIGR00027 family)